MAVWMTIALGLTMLLLGGELLVRGAVASAKSMGMSPLLIGLTLVGFDTSTPELVTSVTAALNGSPALRSPFLVRAFWWTARLAWPKAWGHRTRSSA